jgi:hypothetical protein
MIGHGVSYYFYCSVNISNLCMLKITAGNLKIWSEKLNYFRDQKFEVTFFAEDFFASAWNQIYILKGEEQK